MVTDALMKALINYSRQVNGLETFIGKNFFAQYAIQTLHSGEKAMIVHNFFAFDEAGNSSFSLKECRKMFDDLLAIARDNGCEVLISQIIRHPLLEHILRILLYFNFRFRYIGNDFLWLECAVTKKSEHGG